MKIQIEISKRKAKHLQSPHTFYGNCREAEEVLLKVQEEINKKFKEKK